MLSINEISGQRAGNDGDDVRKGASGQLYQCKTLENSNFLKNDKMVISIKIQNFSRSQMMKRTSPLESSREI